MLRFSHVLYIRLTSVRIQIPTVYILWLTLITDKPSWSGCRLLILVWLHICDHTRIIVWGSLLISAWFRRNGYAMINYRLNYQRFLVKHICWGLIVASILPFLGILSQILVASVCRSQAFLRGRTGTGVTNLVIFSLFFPKTGSTFVGLLETFFRRVAFSIRYWRSTTSNLCSRLSLLNPGLFLLYRLRLLFR